MKFLELKAENFLSFKALTYDFSDTGLCSVIGENRDSSPVSSNGAGKTSLLNSVCYALYGKLPSEVRVDEIIYRGAGKGLMIFLRLQLGDAIYEIIRTRKHPKYGNDLILSTGEHVIRGKSIKETQDILEQLLGMDYQKFVNSVYFSPASMSHSILSCTNANRRKVFNDLTDLSKYDKMFETIKAEHKITAEEKETLVSRLREVDNAIQAQSTVSVKEKYKAWEESHKKDIEDLQYKFDNFDLQVKAKLDKLQSNLLEIQEAIDSGVSNLEAKESELAEYEKDQKRLKDNLYLNKDIDSIDDKISDLREQIKDLTKKKDDLNLLIGSDCPTCGSKVCETNASKVQENIESELMMLKEKGKELIASRKDLNARSLSTQEIARIHDCEKNTADLIKTIKNLKHSLEINKDVRSKLEARIESQSNEANPYGMQLDKLSLEKNPYKELLDQYDDQLTSLKQRKDKFEKGITRLKEQATVWSSWKFFEKKFKASLMDDTLISVNTHVNRVLNELSSGNLMCEFILSEKDEILIEIKSKGATASYASCSFGEQALIRFSVQVGFLKFLQSTSVHPFHFVMLDEIFNGMDSVNKDKALSLLASELSDLQSVYIIDHSPEVIEKLDSSILVVKENGVSHVS